MMSDRTTTGQPKDSGNVSGTCPSEGRQAGSKAVSQAGTTFTNARDHGTSAGADKATGNLREVTPLDALAATVCLIRPDWRHDVVRATLARTNGSWREIATRALRVALDDDSRTPYAIENGDMRRYEASDALRHPSARTWREVRAELLALDGDGVS